MPSKVELELLLERERTLKLICAELNNFMDLEPVMCTVISHIKRLTNCEAVSLRLRDDSDYPYFVHNGFPVAFIRHENSLCSIDENGDRVTVDEGNGFQLECMCGNIISGKIDPSLSCFTGKGSFWSSDVNDTFAHLAAKECVSRMRNYCGACGYNSLALIPIKSQGGIIGLIQLNDKRLKLFNRKLIDDLEMIAEQIGLAIQNSLVYVKNISTDALTNVLNRKGLFEAISFLAPLSKRNQYNVGVMMIDIDNFKNVNDTYGHQKGDQVLQQVADIIKKSIRASDVLGRYGGEEFLLFMSPVEGSALPNLAEKLRARVENGTKDELPVTISLGVSLGLIKADEKNEIDQLIQKADQLLYAAKNSGRNKFVIEGV